ncbi:MAG: M48 family metalloprotease [Proteobacteria bacterium]|nr:M48 family metalloprotease [Pseudomonadota bacterium]
MRQLPKQMTAGAVALALGLLAPPAAAGGLIRDAEIERTLRTMTAPIFQAAGFRPDGIDLYIINDHTLNAFVANGNNMFLHTGLLQTLETPEELMAVIAHETGHLAGGHQARRQINIRNARGPALLGLLVGLAAGVAGGGAAGTAVIAGSQSAIQRIFLRYNRGEEAAADQAALDYLARARVDPIGLQKLLRRFRGQEVFNLGNIDPFVLTHPLSTERMQLVERRVAEAAGRQYPANPERAYWHGRMRAKLIGYLDSPERVLNRLEGEPETEQALYTRAVALYRLPAMSEAIAATDRLIALRPDDPFYIELKGQILFETGHPEQAVPLYRQAVRLAPGEPLLEAGLGRALLALGRPEADAEALKVLRNARRRDLADATALRALATAYSRAGDHGMAELATAERYALTGNVNDAMLHARRAAAELPEGSPGWLRAQDILSLKAE